MGSSLAWKKIAPKGEFMHFLSENMLLKTFLLHKEEKVRIQLNTLNHSWVLQPFNIISVIFGAYR